MKKIAVFGKPGNGKSTFSKKLAISTGIDLYQLDSIIYQKNGEFVDRTIVDAVHKRILSSERWIIDGLGPMQLFNERLEAADTLVYIDLPYPISYWLVTKRMLKGLFVHPEGWPKGSSVVKGTLNSYKTLKQCPQFWNNDFRIKLQQRSENKSLFIIDSLFELNQFVNIT